MMNIADFDYCRNNEYSNCVFQHLRVSFCTEATRGAQGIFLVLYTAVPHCVSVDEAVTTVPVWGTVNT